MLQEFDELVKRKKQLKDWWGMLSKSTYRGNAYTLRVDLSPPAMVAICGQEYSGAPNYHDAPKWFVHALLNEMDNRMWEIASAAYESEIARLDELIAEHKEAVLAELNFTEE